MAEHDLIVGQSVAHVVELLASHEGAMPVAGATDFIPLVRAGRWRPHLAVDITGLDELRYIRPAAGGLEIGALTAHAELAQSPLVREAVPVLAEAACAVAGPQVRSRGTLGGNVCTASPAGDTLPALLVLEAEVILVSQSAERRLPLSQFMTGPGQTVLKRGEMLKAIRIPAVPAGCGMAFEKLGKRRALVISVVNAAALLVPASLGGAPRGANSRRIREARLALGAVAPTVVRCTAAEEFLEGKELPPLVPPYEGGEEVWEEAAKRVLEAIHPIDDVRASAAYRRSAAVGLARRTLARAWRESLK